MPDSMGLTIASNERWPMWKVTARKRELTKCVIVDNWARVRFLSRKAVSRGWTVTVERYYSDVWVAHNSGVMIKVASKVKTSDCQKFVADWQKADHANGCIFWPHGQPMPDRLSV